MKAPLFSHFYLISKIIDHAFVAEQSELGVL